MSPHEYPSDGVDVMVAEKRVPRWLRVLLIIVGTLAVALGILGIVLPLLPTTPFMLLAAACYIRSSRRLYQWLVNNRIFGKYIKNYREGRGLPLHAKLIVLALLWGTIGYSVVYVAQVVWLRVVLIGIAAAVSLHLVRLKTALRN